MHEMGITQGILETAINAAEESGMGRITEVRITIGELTEIMEFALQFAYESLTPGTIAEGSVLVVQHVGASSHCNDCGSDYEHDRFEMLCPKCGSFNVTLLTGREMRIDSIEADDEAPVRAAESAASSVQETGE